MTIADWEARAQNANITEALYDQVFGAFERMPEAVANSMEK
jgi:hypothetical protein